MYAPKYDFKRLTVSITRHRSPLHHNRSTLGGRCAWANGTLVKLESLCSLVPSLQAGNVFLWAAASGQAMKAKPP
ncbi:MAG: hypothetical protein RM368_14575 [Nostoc sp. DedSLP03]|uniref:hypothetical protein n=1 Tax=Nostoc sp. DedSLP03 TaxID=3075400 RepID=UPI002AD53BCD|nr:hypothetical protein [Nostoc sp. DedSLP03]MDZ7966184.1 hypothetical protein [Nostoc sp. DedSLP03]